MVPYQSDNERRQTVFVWHDGFQQRDVVDTRSYGAGPDRDNGRLITARPGQQTHQQDDHGGIGSGARQPWLSHHLRDPEIDLRHVSWPGPARYFAQQALNRPPTPVPWIRHQYSQRSTFFPGPDVTPSPPRHNPHWMNCPHSFGELPVIPQPLQHVVGPVFELENPDSRHPEPDGQGNDSQNPDFQLERLGLPVPRQSFFEASRHNFRGASFPTVLAEFCQPDSVRDNEIRQHGLSRHLRDFGLRIPSPSGRHKEREKAQELPVDESIDVPPLDLENDADMEDDPDFEDDSDPEDHSDVEDDPKPPHELRQTIWPTFHPTPSNSSLMEPKEWETGFDTISDVDALLSPSVLGPLSFPAIPDTRERDFTWIQEVQGAVNELGMLIDGEGYPDIRDGWRGDIETWLEEQVNVVKERPEDEIWKGPHYNELNLELIAVRNSGEFHPSVKIFEERFVSVEVGPVELPGSEKIEIERKSMITESCGAVVGFADAGGRAPGTRDSTLKLDVEDGRRCHPLLSHVENEGHHADLATIGVEDETDDDPIPEEYRPRNEDQNE